MENQAVNSLCVPIKPVADGGFDHSERLNKLAEQERQQRVLVAKLQETENSLKLYQAKLRNKIDACRIAIDSKKIETGRLVSEEKDRQETELQRLREANDAELAAAKQQQCTGIAFLETLKCRLVSVEEERCRVRQEFKQRMDEFMQALRESRVSAARAIGAKYGVDGVDRIADAVSGATARQEVVMHVSAPVVSEVLPDPRDPVADRFSFATWMLKNSLKLAHAL